MNPTVPSASLPSLADLQLEREILLAERAKLLAEIAAQEARRRQPYDPDKVFRFKGKANWKRDGAPVWPCGCKPYRDILTPGRWRALGYMIVRGESAPDDRLHRAGKNGRTPVFCRCQVGYGTCEPTPLADRLTADAAEPEALASIPF